MIAKCAVANLWSDALVRSTVIIMNQIREDYYDRCRCVDITAGTRIFFWGGGAVAVHNNLCII